MVFIDSIIFDDNGNSFIYIYQLEDDFVIKFKIEIKCWNLMKIEIIVGIKVGEIIIKFLVINSSEYDIIGFK